MQSGSRSLTSNGYRSNYFLSKLASQVFTYCCELEPVKIKRYMRKKDRNCQILYRWMVMVHQRRFQLFKNTNLHLVLDKISDTPNKQMTIKIQVIFFPR